MMRQLLLCILLITVYESYYSQYFDTSRTNIIIRENKTEKELFAIDYKRIYSQNCHLKVKGALGSYQIKYPNGKPSPESDIIQLEKHLVVCKNEEQEIIFRIEPLKDEQFRLLITSDKVQNHWHIPFKRKDSENIYGGGIQFSNYKRYNKSIVNLTQENGFGRGGGSISKWTALMGVVGESFSTYCPMPKFSTSSNRTFQWNDYSYSEVHFKKDAIHFDIFDATASFTLTSKNLPVQLTVSQPIAYNLPKWSLGTIVGVQGGTKSVVKKIGALTEKKVNVNAIWIQDWVGKQPTAIGSRLKWNWKLDEAHYPNFEDFKSHFHQQNIKILGYVNPYFAENGPYVQEGILNGYFISKKDEAVVFKFGGFQGYMLNLFNSEACAWMKQIIQTNLVDQGFSGWMADFAEWYPLSEENLIEDLKIHNEYPVLWAKLNYEIICANSKKELFFFNRSGGIGTENYSAMMWAGDQMVDYSMEDGLGSVFDAYLSSAYSGLPLIHSDLGGYSSVKKPFIKNYLRKKELLKDWMLLEAFTPVFRSHEGLHPESNLQVYSDSSIIQSYKKFSDINHNLLPYFEQLIEERNTYGTPVFREINHVLEHFETQNPGFCVGDKIIILYQKSKINLSSLIENGWQIIDKEGKIGSIPKKDNKVVVAVKDLHDFLPNSSK